MPRISENGINVAMGVAGHQGVMNGAFIPDSFGPQFFNDVTAVFEQPSNGHLVLYDITTGQRTLQVARSSNDMYAGGNVWALWADHYGLLASTGFYSEIAGLLDVGPDGAVGYVVNRQDGWGANVREKNGTDWVLDPRTNVVYSLQLLGARRAIYYNHLQQIITIGLPFCVQVGSAYGPKAVDINGEWWVLYFSTLSGLIFHPFNSTIGYQIVPPGIDAWGHCVALYGNLAKIVWSTTAGEAPGDYRERLINTFTEPRKQLIPKPPDPPVDPMNEPAVTVDKWTLKNMNDGNEFIFHDRNNTDLGYKIRVHIRGGSMYAEITNAAGTASTGAFRAVEKCPEIPPIPPIDPPNNASILLDGKFFKRDNQDRMTVIESSEFSLFKRYLDNDHPTMDPVLQQRRELGFNTLRVWLLNTSVVAFRNGVQQDGIHPNQYPDYYPRLTEFVDMLGQMGFCVELTVFTSCGSLMPDGDEQQRHLDNTAKAVRGRKNVILELVNENDQYDNAVNPNLIQPDDVIISHGSNGADHMGVQPMWDYTQYHTNGLSEWQRKVGHNAMELADEFNIPCVSNENTRYPDNDSSENHAYDAAAGASLLCAGACFHSQNGKWSAPFDNTELRCARKWIEGANSVPLEFQVGQYARHDEMNGPNVIRAYSRTLPDGRSHLVLIRP